LLDRAVLLAQADAAEVAVWGMDETGHE
jgi:hypothetical protein